MEEAKLLPEVAESSKTAKRTRCTYFRLVDQRQDKPVQRKYLFNNNGSFGKSDNLIDNLILYIFSFLAPIDILTNRTVCRLWSQLTNNERLWQKYILDLQLPTEGLSTPQDYTLALVRHHLEEEKLKREQPLITSIPEIWQEFLAKNLPVKNKKIIINVASSPQGGSLSNYISELKEQLNKEEMQSFLSSQDYSFTLIFDIPKTAGSLDVPTFEVLLSFPRLQGIIFRGQEIGHVEGKNFDTVSKRTYIRGSSHQQNLSNLNFAQAPLTEAGMRVFERGWDQMFLTEIDISHCRFNDFSVLGNALSRQRDTLRTLRFINLFINSPEKSSTFVRYLKRLTHLQSLDLSNAERSKGNFAGFVDLKESLQELKELKTLNLRGLGLTDKSEEAGMALAELFATLSLENLGLSSNNLTGRFGYYYGQIFRLQRMGKKILLPSLEVLNFVDLTINNIHLFFRYDNFAQEYDSQSMEEPAFLRYALQTLESGFNKIMGEKLKTLDLGFNKIKREGLETLHVFFERLTSLEHLELSVQGVNDDTEICKLGGIGAYTNLYLRDEKFGYVVTKDFAKNIRRLKQLVNQGNAEAQTKLGVCYYYGRGVEKDVAKAMSLWRLAADQGHATAQQNLGICFHKGEGVVQDFVKAFSFFQSAAEQTTAAAQYMLGISYENGVGVERYGQGYCFLSTRC